MLNWQIGKKYRCRNGVVVTLNRRDNICGGNSVWDELLYFDQGVILFAKNGKAWQDHVNKDSENDIIEEVKENEMKIEVGKYYKNVRGDKVYIGYEVKKGAMFPFRGHIELSDGTFYQDIAVDENGANSVTNMLDLIEEWKELKSGVAYVNCYPDHLAAICHHSREKADEDASDDRIACVRVDWKEGQFDD